MENDKSIVKNGKESTTVTLLERIEKDYELSRLWSCLSPAHRQQIMEIEKGARIPNLLSDTIFKAMFDPDTQGKRLSELLSCILGKKVKVLHSLNKEGLHTSIYVKGIILDLVVQFEDGSIGHVEIQRYGERIPPQRAVSYSSELIRRQYAVDKGMNKNEVDYSIVMPVYSIIIMEHSTEEFQNSPYYHHSFSQCSNTGVHLELLQHYDYICLDKFRDQKPQMAGELEKWLMFLSIRDAEEMLRFLCKNKSFQAPYECAIMMTKDRKGLMAMIYDLFEEEDIVKSLIKTRESIAKKESARLAKENESLEKKLVKLSERKGELESRTNELENRTNELESRTNELESRNNELLAHNRELEEEILRLKSQLGN